MEKFEGYMFTALCSTNFLVSCLLFSRVTREQREPYMDEIFHVPQAQRYCQGKFNETRTTSRRVLSTLSLSTFPVLYFFNFLYYTDAGSTFFILFAYLMTLYGCHNASALPGICSVLFRQTNIIWVLFCAGTLVAAKMDNAWRTEHTKKRDEKSLPSQWDPMITTLPGLYLVSVGIIKPMVWLADLTGDVVCSTAMLRFINLLFNCGNLYLIYLLICKLHHREKTRTTSRRVLSALSLSTFPVLYFFNFLYYTDAGSTFFILFAYLMTLYGCHKASALLGICSVLFRQTNIIWVLFCAGTLVAAKMDDAWRTEHTKKRDEKSLPSQVPLSLGGAKKVMAFAMEFLTSPGHVKAVLQVAWPYALVGVAFLVFAALNDGIVVGDRTSHEACFNVPQLFYFFSFSLFFSLPVSLCHHRALRFLQALKKQPFFFLFITTVSLLLVWKFTFVHKYLLADNRHFPFYVWKNVFQRHQLVRFLLVPAYVFAGWNFLDSFKSRSLFWSLAYLACLLCATIPQKLLEFRYFIVPYLMYRLHMPLPSLSRLVGEILLYTAVNAATIYIFVAKTFHWPDSNATQRFMW